MSKEAKDSRESKHRPEALRQPLRKDSLSSVFSWAGLQAKSSIPKTSAASTTSPQPTQQSSPSNDNPKSRRHSHSHSQSLDIQKKARKASTTSRRFSFSNPTGIDESPVTKTKQHAKTTSATTDSKSQYGNATTKTSKVATSSDKSSKPAQDAPPVRKEASQHPLQETTQDTKPSSNPPERPTSPMPKSILRVSSPDGQRPTRHIISFPAPSPPTDSLDQQLNSPEPPPLSPLLSPTSPFQPTFPDLTTSPSSPALESPPNSPIFRPLSPGATVRFAKATIHRVEVGPGRRFIPVKRKSKSTITYIAPLDPGTQKPAPKNLLGSPTKLRRHQENQAAMGRYWLRTEEEEAQWRAEAAQKAAEEAARYRAEPPRVGGGDVKPPVDVVQGFKLGPVDEVLELDKLEEEISEGEEDGDGEGAAVGVPETPETAALAEASEAEVDTADEEYPDLELETEKKQEGTDDKGSNSKDKEGERAATPTSLLLEKPKADIRQSTTTASIKPEAPITPRLGANIQAQSKRDPSEHRKPAHEDRHAPPEPARRESRQSSGQHRFALDRKYYSSSSSSWSSSDRGEGAAGDKHDHYTSLPRIDERSSTSVSSSSTYAKKKLPEPSEPVPIRRHRSSATMTSSVTSTSTQSTGGGSTGAGSGGGGGGGGEGERREVKANHLHLSGRRNRRTLMFDEHKHEITA
ncbi:hypothetical protein B0T22DRAFT_230239 [Podospora appendiculata]|uniref:Uncharacterized protein n=1 Tax=Podospora appendiculata TaxID=314037 RepID=A0AAE0X6B1_9PEZI|nr:hypothetical protein B0T22DRAFT_230239 [Podospora appendiculata]